MEIAQQHRLRYGDQCIGDVYRFLMKALDGRTAESEFEKYLCGVLSSELLACARRWVEEERGVELELGLEPGLANPPRKQLDGG